MTGSRALLVVGVIAVAVPFRADAQPAPDPSAPPADPGAPPQPTEPAPPAEVPPSDVPPAPTPPPLPPVAPPAVPVRPRPDPFGGAFTDRPLQLTPGATELDFSYEFMTHVETIDDMMG